MQDNKAIALEAALKICNGSWDVDMVLRTAKKFEDYLEGHDIRMIIGSDRETTVSVFPGSN